MLKTDYSHSDDPNIIFLSSSMNNMLVCAILQGINIDLKNLRISGDNESILQHEIKTTKFYKLEVLD